eukprot:TRINITY_DN1774_c0_g1_i2.p1 TRINITY_DN1774_c0_g1~~TRINITY_DN1774_c0_g1_i2.p1  ORF type:complete len:345 (+),score=25.97 TRINITY_DN1774_c0_g1_i2:77-1036(+)
MPKLFVLLLSLSIAARVVSGQISASVSLSSNSVSTSYSFSSTQQFFGSSLSWTGGDWKSTTDYSTAPIVNYICITSYYVIVGLSTSLTGYGCSYGAALSYYSYDGTTFTSSTAIGQVWGTLSWTIPLINGLSSLNYVQLTNNSPFSAYTSFNGGYMTANPGTTAGSYQSNTNLYPPPLGNGVDTVTAFVNKFIMTGPSINGSPSVASSYLGKDAFGNTIGISTAYVIANTATGQVAYFLISPIVNPGATYSTSVQMYVIAPSYGNNSLKPLSNAKAGAITLRGSGSSRRLLQTSCAYDTCGQGSTCPKGYCIGGKCYCY